VHRPAGLGNGRAGLQLLPPRRLESAMPWLFPFAKHLLESLQKDGYHRCMSTTPYKPRIVERELRLRLESAGAVVIEGPKACGKTATAETMAASAVRLDVDEQARRAAEIEPALVLDGVAPRLIDEWQVVPAIWNHVRRAVDARRKPGQFILTGSAVPADDVTRHTGAGRLARVRMRPSGRTAAAMRSAARSSPAVGFATQPGWQVATLLCAAALAGRAVQAADIPADLFGVHKKPTAIEALKVPNQSTGLFTPEEGDDPEHRRGFDWGLEVYEEHGTRGLRRFDAARNPPNIVFILADDLGHGDIGPLWPRMPTL
jgi:hypothetical protein